MAEAGIARYYDRLNRWNRVARAFGYGGGRQTLTVHRALSDPRAHGRATTTRLHDIIYERLPPLDDGHVLDAGCGLGGTMLDIARRGLGNFTGITLSDAQAASANDAAQASGLADRVSARVQSYDTPPAGPFDVVLAIESLAHSQNPATTLSALAGVMRRGATFVVVDDMPEPHADPLDLETFKSGWRCPVLWGAVEWREALARERFTLLADRDLTPECRPRTLTAIARLERLNHLAATLPIRGLRDVLHSHRGGLALERLLRTGGVKYRMLVASMTSG